MKDQEARERIDSLERTENSRNEALQRRLERDESRLSECENSIRALAKSLGYDFVYQPTEPIIAVKKKNKE